MTSLVTGFDPMDKEHVLWLQKVDIGMATITDNERVNIDGVINDNPITKSSVKMVDWAFIHFQLALKYSQAVLRGKAFIPVTSS